MKKVIPLFPKKEEDIKELLDPKPKTLDKLIVRANDIALHSEDYTVERANTSNIFFNEMAGLTFKANDNIHRLPVSRYALGQLGTKIGVPINYLEKCIISGRIDLARENVNSWLEEYNKDLFIRKYNGRVRGILSSRYSVCDSHEILKVVDDVVDLSNYKIKGSFLNEERLHVRLVGEDMLPIDEEDLFVGLFIDSSDVGRSILNVQFGLYKQVCTNGLTINKFGGTLFQQKHMGIKSEDFYTGLYKALERVDELTEIAIGLVNSAKNESCGFDLDKGMSDEAFKDVIAQIRRTTDLSEEGATKVISLMKEKYGDSKWGMINSVTEVSQDYTLEKRLKLERIAGNMLVA